MDTQASQDGKGRDKTVAGRLLDLISWGRRGDSWDRTVALDAVPPPSLLGEPLPRCLRERYRFRRILGRGGFGVVVLARDMTIGRLVAIKQLYPALMARPRAHQRFLEEARIAGRLAHPNVVTVFTVEETEDSCCIVMEYLGGGSLAQRFQAGQAPPDLATVLSVLMGVLEGLQAAHTLGIVHRDLKPENILFDGLGAPRISDFGVAVLSRAAGGGNDAGTDGVAGTPLYMAPEQFDRRRNVDPRADLYAIGLIFYELVTGRRIVDLLRIERLPAKDELLALPARLPRDLLDARLNQPLKQALLQLLAADPERRMTSAGELLDLFRAQAGALGLRPDLPCWQRTPGGVTSRADVLRDVIELLLADGIMGPGERAELQRRAERLGVDESTARELEEQVRAARGLPTLAAIEVFTRLAARVLGRGSPAPAAVARLAARGRELGIAPEEQEFIAAGLRRGRGPT